MVEEHCVVSVLNMHGHKLRFYYSYFKSRLGTLANKLHTTYNNIQHTSVRWALISSDNLSCVSLISIKSNSQNSTCIPKFKCKIYINSNFLKPPFVLNFCIESNLISLVTLYVCIKLGEITCIIAVSYRYNGSAMIAFVLYIIIIVFTRCGDVSHKLVDVWLTITTWCCYLSYPSGSLYRCLCLIRRKRGYECATQKF